MSGSIEELKVGGQEALCLRNGRGEQVVVLRHGAQVLSWKTADGIDRFYVSPLPASAGQPVRGGVPVIFPQFNQRGPDFSLPRHGFARTLPWTLSSGESSDAPMLMLSLADSPDTRLLWPFAFELQLRVQLLPGQLMLQLLVHNRGDQPMPFTAALHTYLAVPALADSRLHGLDGCRKLDTLVDQPGVAADGALQLGGPIDDIFFDVPRPLVLESGAGRLRIGMSGGFHDVVVWNPGEKNARSIGDMPDEDWQRMLCVEAACIGEPSRLAAGERWHGGQTLTVVMD